eukprot:TRINITY_DN9626_c0_g1_i3.p1 TRINITY_DN9626_c0_g1~~TRINITY_DN9626_c0_g1_i3.p1  ORF type:complete len:656 (-),score=76.57 TRINITY_DN9626_c0_g1_i3:353-2320(-)
MSRRDSSDSVPRRRPHKVLYSVAVAVVSTSLHGCKEEERYDAGLGEVCPAWFDPLVQDFVPDMSELREATGCDDSFNLFTGSTGAHTIPIPGGSRCLDASMDEWWILSNARNSYGECLYYNNDFRWDHYEAGSDGWSTPPPTTLADGTTLFLVPRRYCAHWTYHTYGCAADEREECQCQVLGEHYCKSWNCWAVTMDQRTCWQSEVETPIMQCVAPGQFPLELSEELFKGLIQAGTGVTWETTPAYGAATQFTNGFLDLHPAFEKFDVLVPWMQTGSSERVFKLDQATFNLPDQSNCFGQGRFRTHESITTSSVPSDCQSSGWRPVDILFKECRCMREAAGQCEAWSCDTPKNHISVSVEGYLENGWDDIDDLDWAFEEQAVCIGENGSASFPVGHQQCAAWHSRKVGLLKAEIEECRACNRQNNETCNWWACTSYGYPRTTHFDRKMLHWGPRFGAAFGYCFLLFVIFCMVRLAEAHVVNSDDERTQGAGPSCLACCGLFCWNALIVGVLVYVIMFARVLEINTPYARTENRSPWQPFLGVCIISVCGCCVTFAGAFRRVGEQPTGEVATFSACLGVQLMLLMCIFWNAGIAGVLFLCVPTCGAAYFLRKAKIKAGGNETSPPGPVYDYGDESRDTEATASGNGIVVLGAREGE